MSRIGLKPITIKAGVTLNINGNEISATGPKGTLMYVKRPEIDINIADGVVTFSVSEKYTGIKGTSAFLGLTRALVNNMITGVSDGFEKKLELVGVGYRAKMNGVDSLGMTLGFSHPIDFKLPKGITAEVADNQQVVIKGIDKYLVGQVAANIRKIRKPEPYKGKGIRYSGEVVRRKQGKSGKV